MDTFKVLKNFQDSQNGFSLHKTGEVVKLTKARGEQLSETGYVEATKEKATDSPDSPAGVTVVEKAKIKGSDASKTKEEKTPAKTKEEKATDSVTK